jgi:hypothetical protein
MNKTEGDLQRMTVQILRSFPESERPLVAWQVVCGSQVARQAEAFSYQPGILTVVVPDRTWAEQLAGLSNQYLQKLDTLVPGQVKQIEFRVRTR